MAPDQETNISDLSSLRAMWIIQGELEKIGLDQQIYNQIIS